MNRGALRTGGATADAGGEGGTVVVFVGGCVGTGPRLNGGRVVVVGSMVSSQLGFDGGQSADGPPAPAAPMPITDATTTASTIRRMIVVTL